MGRRRYPAPPRCTGCAAPLPCDLGHVQVPEEFRAHGYSGLFHITVQADGPTIDAWGQTPRLISGWLLLSADREAGTVVLVRNDWVATMEALTTRRPATGPVTFEQETLL